MKILLNIIATNKYISFLDLICPTIDSNFLKNLNVDILLHTNQEIPEDLKKYERINFLKNDIIHEEWPMTTLKRFHYFLSKESIQLEYDYCFYIDADSKFIGEINEEILPESGIIGTIHPCLFNGSGTPDRNPHSTAYLPNGSNNRYFCGGFFGGKSEDFIKMSHEIKNNIEIDIKNGVIALWHDESHLNKYLFNNPPSLILEHPFAIAENISTNKIGSKILFLDKSTMGGHEFFRT